MFEFTVNYVAVLVAAIVAMAVGAAWYSPALFGKEWMKLMKIDPNDETKMKEMKKGMGKTYFTSFVATLVMAYVLAFFIKMSGSSGAMGGATVAFWAWLGFVATVGINSILFEKKPTKLYLINIGHYLAAMVVMGAVVAAWQ